MTQKQRAIRTPRNMTDTCIQENMRPRARQPLHALTWLLAALALLPGCAERKPQAGGDAEILRLNGDRERDRMAAEAAVTEWLSDLRAGRGAGMLRRLSPASLKALGLEDSASPAAWNDPERLMTAAARKWFEMTRINIRGNTGAKSRFDFQLEAQGPDPAALRGENPRSPDDLLKALESDPATSTRIMEVSAVLTDGEWRVELSPADVEGLSALLKPAPPPQASPPDEVPPQPPSP
ncbi:MAG: hypothetical protein GMKNLPBB_02592 [Myxococcota bacterium]|nr:hypothetical protein [Myxococcota bacterium]